MKEFHIHFNLSWIDDNFKRTLLQDLGFSVDHFIVPSGHTFTEHLSKKLFTKNEFESMFQFISGKPSLPSFLEGYIEGECVAFEKKIPYKKYTKNIAFPLRVTKVPVGNAHRQSEIHISMNKEDSSEIVKKNLLDIGFDRVSVIRKKGVKDVFTLQGSTKDMRIVLKNIVDYLTRVGGVVDCKVKEERTLAFWISSPLVVQPEIVKRIEINE